MPPQKPAKILAAGEERPAARTPPQDISISNALLHSIHDGNIGPQFDEFIKSLAKEPSILARFRDIDDVVEFARDGLYGAFCRAQAAVDEQRKIQRCKANVESDRRADLERSFQFLEELASPPEAISSIFGNPLAGLGAARLTKASAYKRRII
jgi:hypothetical protein